MSQCSHGFPPEICIHCASERKLKPKVQLNFPSPSEVPIPVPRKSQLLKPKELPNTELYTPVTPFLHTPPKLTRTFDLDQDFKRDSSTLLDERIRERIERKGLPQGSDVLEDPYITGDLIDIRKKFMKVRD